LVILFLINFITTCNSFVGPMILLSMSSSSGEIAESSSSMAVSYLLMFRMVCAASGCLPMRSYSPARGWKRVEKRVANPAPDVKRAVKE